jgi:hypothetical protein
LHSERDAAREARRRYLAAERAAARADRTVRDLELRDAEAVDRRRAPHVRSRDDLGLLLDGELGEELLDSIVHREPVRPIVHGVLLSATGRGAP